MVAHAPAQTRAFETPEIVVLRPRLTRSQLIQQIFEVNSTATPGFLAHFTDDQLRDYLDHLTVAADRRGPATVWTRRDSRPAIAACASDE